MIVDRHGAGNVRRWRAHGHRHVGEQDVGVVRVLSDPFGAHQNRHLGLPAWLAALPASFTVLIALRVLSECMMVPSYHARWLTVGECGTGFTDPEGVLMFDLPFLLGLSGLCWWLAAYAPYVGNVARCAFTTAAGAWLITFAAFQILT